MSLSLTMLPIPNATLGDSILIAVLEKFYIIDNNKLTTFINNAYEDSLYPSYIAEKDRNNIYIGMQK